MNPIDRQLQAEEVDFQPSRQQDMMMGDSEQQARISWKRSVICRLRRGSICGVTSTSVSST